VALINARLHDSLARKTQELEERTVELEAQKTRVEALLAEKSERIDELSDQLSAKQEVLEHRYDYSQIIGRSPAMSALLRLLDRIIPTSTSVLIQGESGTGKELVARAIHFNGPRRQGPFVSLNCGAMPEALLESELFGHVRGAFTDAREDRRGLLLSAQGGTIFLDEVGEMPPSMQVKLLRALEERRIRPVGGTREASIDIRLICATNRDLLEEIGRGAFREDLYYRLAVVGVTLPPLRDRPTDVPLLADHILDRVAREHGIMRRPLSPSALRALVAHDWPGNVRQLENALTKATLLVRGQTIAARDLELPAPRRANHGAPANDRSPASREAFQRTESEEIAHLLAAHRWNISKTARALGMSRTTLYTKMRLHGLSR
jgi:DNA-binding NtrC family response regulator